MRFTALAPNHRQVKRVNELPLSENTYKMRELVENV